MAFADDLVLLQDRDVDMPATLDAAETFLSARGMSINPKKCVSISAVRVRGTAVTSSKPVFKISGQLLPALGTFATFRYLGLRYGAAGALKANFYNLTTWLNNLERSPLKPQQKLELLRTHIVPKLVYGLQSPKLTAATLRECDRLIRRTTTKILHLNAHTGNQHLHVRVSDGGLGIPETRRLIPWILSKRFATLRHHSDPVIASILENPGPALSFMLKTEDLVKGPPDAFWREEISVRPFRGAAGCGARPCQ